MRKQTQITVQYFYMVSSITSNRRKNFGLSFYRHVLRRVPRRAFNKLVQKARVLVWYYTRYLVGEI